MPLTQDELRQIEDVAELKVRRYFDAYLTDTFPRQVEALREHTTLMVAKHDDDENAHGSVERRFNRLLWLALGSAAAGGTGVGFSLKTLLSLLG